MFTLLIWSVGSLILFAAAFSLATKAGNRLQRRHRDAALRAWLRGSHA